MQCKVNYIGSSDRFIPYRSRRSIETATYFIRKETNEIDLEKNGYSKYTNPALFKWKKKVYQEALSEIMDLRCKKIINIPRAINYKLNKELKICHRPWPVRARRKPLIEAPEMVLNMPDLDTDLCHHVTDWGCNNILAFVFEAEVYIWKPELKEACILSATGGRVTNCVQWNKTGTKLAVGLNNAGFAIIDCQKNSLICESICLCSVICNITSIKWTSNNTLITGCSEGRLCTWDSSLHLICTHFAAHMGAIITIAFSNNERYIATTGVDAKARIWYWPNMVDNFEVVYVSSVRGIAWHPWKETLFAIGGGIGEGSLTLWSASSQKQIAHKASINNSFIDDLTWNRITGELVVSYWHPNEQNYAQGKNSIVVLSDLNTEVDVIECHTANVLYLLWGSNDTKLGTAGIDDKFCIWDFLGTSKEKVKLYKTHSKKKYRNFPFMGLAAFGQTIR